MRTEIAAHGFPSRVSFSTRERRELALVVVQLISAVV
jgi:hypothetical protein